MNPLQVFPACAISVVVASSVLATDRYFSDSFGNSPNGKLRIDAKSPDNQGQRRPFASNFTYTLTDLTSNKVLWTRKQPMTRGKGDDYAHAAEPSPIQVFVTDDGLVAARSSHESVIILEPSSGEKRFEADILKTFPQQQQQDFIHQTTAGPRWSQHSSLYFLSLPAQGKESANIYFVIHPYWHHRLVLDTKSGKFVDLGALHNVSAIAGLSSASVQTTRLLTAIVEEETRSCKAGLQTTPEAIRNDKQYRDAYRKLSTGLYLCGFLGLVDQVPRLRELELSMDSQIDSYGELRKGIRQALRALGEAPQFKDMWCGNRDREQPSRLTTEVLALNASKVKEGMPLAEASQLLGCPDADPYDGGHCSDFDIDAAEPYTLRVWEDKGKITRIKKITPFAFLHDVPRMSN